MKLFTAKGIINGDGELILGNSILIKEGIIAAIGEKAALLTEYPDAECFTYNGFIYPGFIDSHIHFTGTGVDMLSVDCRKTNDFYSLFETLKMRADELGVKQLLIAAFFDPDNYLEKNYPTIEVLDSLFPNNPVFISHIECHGAIINSNFKELFGGELTDNKGLIVGEENSKARRFIFDNLAEEYKIKGFKMVEQEALAQGVTSIHAMEGGQLFSDKDVEILLKNKDKLTLDITVYHQTLDVEQVKKRNLKQIGGCLLIDGSSGVYTAAMTRHYRRYPKKRGILYFSESEIIDFVFKAQQNGLQVALHCCGDRAIDFLLNCFYKVDKKQKIQPFRHRIEHFEIPRPDQISRCKELGLTLSMQPSFDHFWGGNRGDYYYTLGKRWKWTNPIGKAIESEVIVGGGSDSGVTPISPLLGIHSAVNHHNPKHRISVSQGIKMFTKNGAYLTFEEERKGDIKLGYVGNLTILKENLLKLRKDKIKDAEVLATIINGKIANSTQNDKK